MAHPRARALMSDGTDPDSEDEDFWEIIRPSPSLRRPGPAVDAAVGAVDGGVGPAGGGGGGGGAVGSGSHGASRTLDSQRLPKRARAFHPPTQAFVWTVDVLMADGATAVDAAARKVFFGGQQQQQQQQQEEFRDVGAHVDPFSLLAPPAAADTHVIRDVQEGVALLQVRALVLPLWPARLPLRFAQYSLITPSIGGDTSKFGSVPLCSRISSFVFSCVPWCSHGVAFVYVPSLLLIVIQKSL